MLIVNRLRTSRISKSKSKRVNLMDMLRAKNQTFQYNTPCILNQSLLESDMLEGLQEIQSRMSFKKLEESLLTG